MHRPTRTTATKIRRSCAHDLLPIFSHVPTSRRCRRTRLHTSVTFAALYLLQRLKARFPAARGSSGHRLFISAYMIASKVICDDTYSNKSWSIVGQGMFALREVNQMEREMCSYLEWQLNIEPGALKEFEAKSSHSTSTSPASSASPATPLGYEDLSAHIVSSGTIGAPMSIDPVPAGPRKPPHAHTQPLPPTAAGKDTKADLFAQAAPCVW
ncbi:PHO85 cyclin-9 [Grifola frondosa]|uniref:PHO85 cyclin-9 n=1 Tax=Grifola frondosa TaxID=5627 RepID=A0A1C7LYH5_GRIFR|nr:PHO85 cyclin-9 [Grifola frondosa]